MQRAVWRKNPDTLYVGIEKKSCPLDGLILLILPTMTGEHTHQSSCRCTVLPLLFVFPSAQYVATEFAKLFPGFAILSYDDTATK